MLIEKSLLQMFLYQNLGGIASFITIWIVVGVLILASLLGLDRPVDTVLMLKFAAIASIGSFFGLPILKVLFK